MRYAPSGCRQRVLRHTSRQHRLDNVWDQDAKRLKATCTRTARREADLHAATLAPHCVRAVQTSGSPQHPVHDWLGRI